MANAAEVTDDEVGDVDLDRVRSAHLLLHRAESRTETGPRRFGPDPMCRAKLGKNVTAATTNAGGAADAMRERAEAGELRRPITSCDDGAEHLDEELA